MTARAAAVLVFASSAAVLVVEIVAGRLLAPYVGVSLETFTGIIGVVLAGIAAGAAAGGHLADARDPRSLLAPALALGGVLVWLSVPIVAALGPQLGEGVTAILLLTAFGFFAPAAVLSAVTPIVAKIRLESLDRTGSVFGGLSAAGTAGGLAGTFLTGFVLVSSFGTRTILYVVGALLVSGAAVVHWWLRRAAPAPALVLVILASSFTVFGIDPPCEYETRYACAQVRVDDDDPSRRSLYLDNTHNARVDVDDPTYLGIRYTRLFADVADALPPGPLEVLHIGGGGFTFARYLTATRPGTTNEVLEIDGDLVEIARERLGFVDSPDVNISITDARTALDDYPDDRFDLVIGDAFSGRTVPWHLTTVEVAAELDRLLRPGGVYVMNVIDGGDSAFARAETATLLTAFDHVAVIWPGAEPPASGRNQILVASDAPLPVLTLDPADGALVDNVAAFIDGADPLTDDFAPADQLADN